MHHTWREWQYLSFFLEVALVTMFIERFPLLKGIGTVGGYNCSPKENSLLLDFSNSITRFCVTGADARKDRATSGHA